jgi:mono/diheme cytochrome c family protein
MRYLLIPLITILAFLVFLQSDFGKNMKAPAFNQNQKVFDASVLLQIEEGKKVFESKCSVCHMKDGVGVKGVFPPLAGNDFLNKKDVKEILIHSVKYGKTGLITVNNVDYNGVMPILDLSDAEIANVLTYVYNSWGNNQTRVSEDEVSAVKKLN